MGNPKPPKNRKEVLRRRKIRKFWADHPEKCEAQSKRQKEVWADQERCKAKSKEMKQFYADHPERSEAQSKRQKRVMRSSKRRKINSTTMMQLKATPEFEARRLAGISKAEATPERKALRRATLAKTLNKRGIRIRRIKNSKKAMRTPEYRAAMSAGKKKMWADLRAGRAALAETAKTRKRGRPRTDDKYRVPAMLKKPGLSYMELARRFDADFPKQFDPDFAKKADAAEDKMRKGIGRIEASKKRGDSPDEPETLHNS